MVRKTVEFCVEMSSFFARVTSARVTSWANVIGVLCGNRFSNITRFHLGFRISNSKMVKFKNFQIPNFLELDFADACVSSLTSTIYDM